MGRNLTNLPISASFQYLTQISGSELTDGLGADIDSLNISASYATSASHAIFADTAGFATDVNALYTASVSDATISFLKGGGGTFPITVNNVANAVSASYATTASFALTASALVGGVSLQSVLDTGNNATGSIVLRNDEASLPAIQVNSPSGTSSTLLRLSRLVDDTPNFVFSAGDATNATLSMGQGGGFGQINLNATGGNKIQATTKLSIDTPALTVTGDITGSANISASGYVSASSFIGDGSQLTNLPVSDPFPYVGDAEITGSLLVSGSAIIGGDNNTISSTGAYNVILNDYGTISGTARESLIAAGGTEGMNTISAGLRNSIISSRQGTIQGGAETSAIIAGLSSTINGGAGLRQAVIIGSRDSSITGGSFYGQAILGARNGTLSGPNAVLIGGQANTISGESAGIFAGYNHNVSALTSAAVGGRSATVSHQDSVVIGGDGLSTTKTQEAVVEHLSIYGDTFISASVLGTGSLIDNLGQEAIVTGSQVQHIVNLSQAEYDALTPDANTLYVIDGAETLGDTVISGSLVGAVNTISDSGGTTALDCSVGNYFTLAMPAGGSTVLTPSNITAGQTINIKITQNATAATLTYAASIDFPGGTAFTISTGSGEVDILTLVSFDGTTLQATGLANFS